jgi:DNA-binding transcriptional regulator YiaG
MGGRPRKMAMAAMNDRASVAKDVAKRLNISTATLYEYVNGDGSPKEPAIKLLKH